MICVSIFASVGSDLKFSNYAPLSNSELCLSGLKSICEKSFEKIFEASADATLEIFPLEKPLKTSFWKSKYFSI
jgi:hypothetical protein